MMEEVVAARFAHDEDFGGMPDARPDRRRKGQLSWAAAMRAAGREDRPPPVPREGGRVRGGRERVRYVVFIRRSGSFRFLGTREKKPLHRLSFGPGATRYLHLLDGGGGSALRET